MGYHNQKLKTTNENGQAKHNEITAISMDHYLEIFCTSIVVSLNIYCTCTDTNLTFIARAQTPS